MVRNCSSHWTYLPVDVRIQKLSSLPMAGTICEEMHWQMVATVFTQIPPARVVAKSAIPLFPSNQLLISVLEQPTRVFLRERQWQAACEVISA